MGLHIDYDDECTITREEYMRCRNVEPMTLRLPRVASSVYTLSDYAPSVGLVEERGVA